MKRTTLTQKLLGLAGAAFLGAIITTVVSYVASAPDVSATVARVSIKAVASVHTSTSLVSVDPELADLTKESSWVTTLEDMPEGDYLKALQELLSNTRRIVRDMNDLSEDLGNWAITRDNAVDILSTFNLLHEHQSIFIAHVFGEVSRTGDPVISYSGREVSDGAIAVNIDEDGDFQLQHDAQVINIWWSVVPQVSDRGASPRPLRSTARALAYGLAAGDPGVLQQIRDQGEFLLSELDLHRRIVERVRAELRAWSAWSISVLVSNSGRDPMSLSPRAALYLVPGNQVDSMRVALELRRTQEASLEDVTGPVLTDLDEPVVVPGGSALSIAFRSSDLIRSGGINERLLAAFDGTGTAARLSLFPLTERLGGLGGQTWVHTPVFAFAEFEFERVFPEMISAR